MRCFSYSFITCFGSWFVSNLFLGCLIFNPIEINDYFIILAWSGIIITGVWLAVVWPIYLWVPTTSLLWEKKVGVPLGLIIGLFIITFLFGKELLYSWYISANVVGVSLLIALISICFFKKRLS